MTYQLVLQWDESCLDYDSLIEIEEQLIASMSAGNDVDGHDVGQDEANIFVLTDNPLSSLREARAILADTKEGMLMRAGYRRLDEDVFTPAWPDGLISFGVS
jgi:hypothetical protein